MQITNVDVRIVDIGRTFLWAGRREMRVMAVFVSIATDGGPTGVALAWGGDLDCATVRTAIHNQITPLLVGTDPVNRYRTLAPVSRAIRVGTPLAALGVVDCALWDLMGKQVNLPVCDLLGRQHDRLKGCASAPPVDSPGQCAAMVEELLADGFKAIKLHACGDVSVDTLVCKRAREVAGDGIELMMDAMSIYDRFEALALGRTLDEQAYRWFEDPLPDNDLSGWVHLRSKLQTPLAGVDAVRFTTADYGPAIASGAFDIVRMDAARQGISQLYALGKLATGFGLGVEGHAFGPALAQAANLQTGLALEGARYCELPVPIGGLDVGVNEGLTLDAEGFVEAPTLPGLGMTVDEDALARVTLD
jgi:L-alanine-DL-glutamate epimerase-like enolase superfamily enzyme